MSASLIERAVALAADLQVRAAALQTSQERRQQAELSRMLGTPADKATLVQLTDQAFRSKHSSRIAEQFTHILDVQGIPRFFSPLDRAMMRGFQAFGQWLPGVSVPLVKEHMRQETANVVLPAEPEHLTKHLHARKIEGLRMNLNFLGEALLGEDEAQHRLEKYLAALQMPEVEVLSVKISTIYSQISALARQHTLRVLCDRLELLYRAAAHQTFTRADGTPVRKFVYLDMEEYRDLHLTAEAFMRTLDRPGLEGMSAGIALQAYVPDSARMQRAINGWARRRVARGGAPVTIRIVKGANMEMERVEAALRDWPQAPFKTKAGTDANYKAMLHEAMKPENLAAVRVGVASHNLFDVAYALVLAEEAGAGERVQFEMLEGMANHQRRALVERHGDMLLYAPACRREEFLNAIGYLLRRLDENTGPENFLSHAFKLTPGSEEWGVLERGFRDSFQIKADDAPRRKQDRNSERFDNPRREMNWRELVNEADTDWSLPPNSLWAEKLVAKDGTDIPVIPLVIDGEECSSRREEALTDGGRQSFPEDLSLLTSAATKGCRDPSRPGSIVARYCDADVADINRAVACARADKDGWRAMSPGERSEVLGRVANELRRARGALMRAALMNGGKTLSESDPEVSEAVDFVEFYRASAREFFELNTVKPRGRGVVAVVPPWNFPIAIPCGGISAALAAGNTVLLKPASDAVLIAWELCRCFWRGGVSRRTLQFVPCSGGGAGAALAAHPHVDAVILTGGTETARRMLGARPEMRLFGETGGKNATIITALSDRELAVRHVVHSAFSHAGQKCSATSLLLLEREVYEDENFKRMFCDAVRSAITGSAWELHSRVGPLIRAPRGELETALKTLEPGESWAVMPHQVGDNPNLWSPGVKWGVTRGSLTHFTEFFGPVLGVMAFDSLDEAIRIVNETGFGLTSSIQSLDEREIETWKAGIRAGNLYINRGTVGAVVLRQPFGGMGKSCFGPGMKAGGPNYVAQLMRFENAEAARMKDARASYERWWRDEFSCEHDHFRLPGQDNIRRYLPFEAVRVRVTPSDSAFEIGARVEAADIVGARLILSRPPALNSDGWTEFRRRAGPGSSEADVILETDDELAARIAGQAAHGTERIRFAAPDRVPDGVRKAAAKSGAWIADEPVLAEGRVELLWYLREQSISHDYHRYGNLGARSGEARREPA